MTDPGGEPVVLEYRGPEGSGGGGAVAVLPPVLSPYGSGVVLIRAGADLPERCVKCNRPASGRAVRVLLRWVDPRDRDGYRGTTYGVVTLIVWLGYFIEGLFK